jgi:hypothetical protein
LSVGIGDNGRILLHCHAGCSAEAVCEALGIPMRDLFPNAKGGRVLNPPNDSATAQLCPNDGCRVVDYARVKKLPADALVRWGLSNVCVNDVPAVRIPYQDAAGEEVAVRFRIAMNGDNRFRWRKGSKPLLYGVWRLAEARRAGYCFIVEGESDCHTLWTHRFPAVGLPGAGNWREERDAANLEGIKTLYVVIEPDKGGETVLKWLATSSIRERVKLVQLREYKDASALHLADPAQFTARLRSAMMSAERWAEREAAEAATKREGAWRDCKALATNPKILERFAADLERSGVVGEVRTAKVLFLALVSRLLDRPISLAIKGPSSAGKSFIAERVLGFFPPSAYYALSAMSERALAYSEEPLSHRFLVIYEAAGLSGEFASYLMRSLLSEGCVRYETVEKSNGKLVSRFIHREGPTGLLLTTTALALHPENETRFFSIGVTDTREQTRNVMLAIARDGGVEIDLSRWHALQTWLGCGEHRVSVPFADPLARAIPTVAVRLRRDFRAVLGLVQAHAILHQASRDRGNDGRIIAALDDYRAVRELIGDTLAEGLDRAIPKEVRETVEAVTILLPKPKPNAVSLAAVPLKAVAERLGLDKGSASRRVRSAMRCGYLKNLEDRRGRSMKLRLGDPLPNDIEILPPAERLASCAVACESRSSVPPPPGAGAIPRERKSA